MNDIESAGAARQDHDDLASSGHERLRAHVRAGWVAALTHDRFGDDDDFFEIGGHSLLIADIMAELAAKAGIRLSLRLFFDNPTVNELTEALASAQTLGSRR